MVLLERGRGGSKIPRKQFTEEQIIATLRPAEAGMPVGEVCRRLGRHKREPLYVWRKRVEEGGPQNLSVIGRPEMLPSDPEAANG